MSILLAIEVLLELAAPIVVFALLHRRVNDETLINCVFGFGKFDIEGGSFLVVNRFGGAFDDAVVFYLDLLYDLRLVIDVDPIDRNSMD